MLIKNSFKLSNILSKLFLVSCITFLGTASAAEDVISDGDVLLGVNGILYNDNLYDVTFQNSTLVTSSAETLNSLGSLELDFLARLLANMITQSPSFSNLETRLPIINGCNYRSNCSILTPLASLLGPDSFYMGPSIITSVTDFPFYINNVAMRHTFNIMNLDQNTVDAWDFKTYAVWSKSSNTNATAPVPEPETYAMMLAGLGLMGFVARRQKNSQA